MSTEPLHASRLSGYLWRARFNLLPGVALALLRALVIAPCPLIFQHIVDREMASGSARGILLWGGLFAVLLAAHYALAAAGAWQFGRALSRLMVELRSRIFFRLQFLSFSYLDRQKTDQLVSKYAFDTQKTEAVLTAILNRLLPTALYAVTLFLLLATLNWQLAAALFVVLPVWGFAKWRFFTRLQRADRAVQLAQEKLAGTATESISALRLSRSLGAEKTPGQLLERKSDDFARSRAEQSWTSAGFGTFTQVGAQAIAALIVTGGALLILRGQMTVGTLIAFLASLPVLLAPMQIALGLATPWFAARESFTSIKELIDSPYVEDWHGARREQRLSGDIVFDRVSFAYPGTEKKVIRDFSFVIRPRETIALIGPAGAGKTTLVNLLLGLYAPTAGQIVLDGVPQREWDMRWIRRQIAVITPQGILLSGTIEENIRLARADATDDEIRTAARAAHAEEFILRLPLGYKTVIGERGAILTPDQRQQLSIARAILRDAPIVILDETLFATGHDPEGKIRRALDRFVTGRTVITLAHGPETTKPASRIVRLADGAIVEEAHRALNSATAPRA